MDPDFEAYIAFPSPALAPFVVCIWGVRGPDPSYREAVLPNGLSELMINFGPAQKVWAYGEDEVDQDFGRYWLAGIQDEPLVIGSPHGMDHIGVRFHPGGAHAFFDLPMSEVTDRVVDLDLLVGRGEAEELRDELTACPDHAARARAVEAWLLERRYAVHPYYSTVRRAVDVMQTSTFRTSVTELCERLGLSNRHLIEQFRRVVGLPPKAVSRIQRFNAVVEATMGRPPGDVVWSRLAYRFGFSDQSHLVREFKHFSGVTPTEFLARRTPDHAHLEVQ